MDENIIEILSSYAKIVDRELERFIPRRVDERGIEEFLGKPMYRYEAKSICEGILKPFWDLLDRGGKRWRPALMLMAYEALGGEIEDIAPLTVIPEAIHNGTLAVDDVEDRSEFRRGKPCIHRIYGEDIAINMGNTMYYLPILILEKLGIDRDKRLRILEEYVKTMVKLSFGQGMDIAWHRGLVEEVDEEQYLEMTLLKTGALAGFSVEIAAIMAGASREVEENLKKFAELVAVAFQIQDDVLNVIGDEAKYGKEIGGDIKEGKRTLMVIHALKKLPETDAKRLDEILNMQTEDRSLIKEAIDLLKKSGSIEYAKEVSRRLAEEAMESLKKAIPDPVKRRKLELLAKFLITREY